MEQKFKGAFTALVTPFTPDGEVDYKGLESNVQHQIDNGINGLLPLGTTGETPTLTAEEQQKVVEAVLGLAKGKVTVLVGTGSNNTAKTVEMSKKAQEWGADAVLVVTPYYNKPTNRGIYEHFKAVSDAISIPIVVYNIAGRTGKNIDTPTMKKIAALENVQSIKEASGDINQMGDVINELPDISVMSGDDGMTLPLMALGGLGVISVVSNLVPDRIVELTDAALAGNFDEAKKIHFELLPLFKVAFIETNPIPIKAAMTMKGLAGGSYRLPMCEMEPENKEKLRQTLEE
ncbi:MAG: 4-hydroxy-tetrahydrodipicolinate synthase, partial [Candidatus Woesearchaeota archaeon]|nr:4-hydroxy-tetrahydrodipicolinate synthase [Candidatus Woesearchaeota archaeon]